jgi:hypothetical protein
MSTSTLLNTTPNYEHRLNVDWEFAMDEGDRFFQQDNSVFKTMRAIAQRLDDLGIPYAVVDGMALNAHGFHRFTEDVDLLVTPEGLKAVHEHLDGRGYVPPFTGSKQLRDTVHGVRVEFLVTGGYPGDGKPKPVAFPDPAKVGFEDQGIRYLRLPTLIELKLASGMSPGRRKDLGDVQELIRLLKLPAEFASELNPYVRDLFNELRLEISQTPSEP